MRKQHSAAFKASVVVEALREAKTVTQIAAQNQIHPTLVTKWKTEALEALTAHFQRGGAREEKTQTQERRIAELYEKIGRLTTQVNWLKKNLASNLSRSGRVCLLERSPEAQLPLIWQADLLSLSRGSLYYTPRPPCSQEVYIKRRMDERFTAHLFLGSRKVVALLAGEGVAVGRHTIRRYRQQMELQTIYPKPNLSRPGGLSTRCMRICCGTW